MARLGPLDVCRTGAGCAQPIDLGPGAFSRTDLGEARFQLPRGFLALGLGFVGFRHRHADLLRQLPHRIDESESAVLAQKPDGVAVRSAAEAVIELLRGTDREARGFLAVEWAQAEIVGPAAAQRDVARHEFDEVDPGDEFLQIARGDH